MRDKIQKNLVYLTEKLSNLTKVCLYLIQKNIISRDEQENILNPLLTSTAKNEKLLTTLEKKDWQRVGNLFLDILRKTNNGHCADKIEGIATETEKVFKNPNILKEKWWPEKQILTQPFHLQNLRPKLLLQLHDSFLKNEHRMVSITESVETYRCFPEGGAGKTLLAKWYAHNIEKYYDHILWIDCGEDSLLKSLQQLARDLNVRNRNELQDAKYYTIKCYDKLAEWKCLWIFDDIKNYQEMIKVLPKYKDNFYCLLTLRRVEGDNKWGFLKISEIELDVVSYKESLDLLKFIDEKLKTKTTKFNYAVSLHNNGQVEVCVRILEELFTRKLTKKNDVTKAIDIIFKFLPENKIPIIETTFEVLDVNRKVTEGEVGTLLLYSHLRLANYQESLKIANQIIADAGQLIKLLAITRVPNYHLEVFGDHVDLILDVNTKKIILRSCSLSLDSFDRISVEEFILHDVSFFRDGQELVEVNASAILDLKKVKQLTLRCDRNKKNLSLDLNGKDSVDYLDLMNVRVLNWNNSHWSVKKLILNGVPFVKKTNITVQEIVIGDCSLDVACLPQTTQKILLWPMRKVFVSGGEKLPNLKHLALNWMSDVAYLCHFHSVPLTHIYLIGIEELNVNFLPSTLTLLHIRGNSTRVVGRLRKVDNLTLNNFSLVRMSEYLRHLHPDNLVVHSEVPIEAKELEQFQNKKIKTIAVGPINWGKADNMHILTMFQLVSEYIFLEEGKGRGIGKDKFDELILNDLKWIQS